MLPKNISDFIQAACTDANITLKHACQKSGVRYNTLWSQITHQRAIPFETIDALAFVLGKPLDYFSQHPSRYLKRKELARDVLALVDAMIDNAEPESPRPTIAELKQRMEEANFRISGIEDMLRYCDMYYPLAAEDELPHPISFGAESLSRQYLKFEKPADYYAKVALFEGELIRQSLQAHKDLKDRPFTVSSQTISEVIDGRAVSGCYLRAAARAIGDGGRERTVIMTQFVAAY